MKNMLHIKDSNKLLKFKDYFNSTIRVISNLISFLDIFSNKSLNLGLGKNQSQDFDSQIASTTISFIQYLMLSLYKRYEKYETIGGAFLESKESTL